MNEFTSGMLGQHIVVLRWPTQAVEARALGVLGVPRLLLIEDGAEPPALSDGLVAWLPMPADDGEFERQLRLIVDGARMSRDAVRIDDHGRMLVGPRWVALSATQARLAVALVDSFGDVVSERCLIEAGRLDQTMSSNSLRVHVSRLRKRLLTVGLELQTVRGQGLVLQRCQSSL
ncbi:MAG: helix-turn-helix domain-containing protein [Candidatus Limnocylindria bacterium]